MVYIVFKKKLLNVTRNNEVDTSGEITFGKSDIL